MTAENRILIVDDTPANIQTLTTILKEKGFQISVATNGKQALEVLKHVHPDLILLDVMMPEMDGFEACERIKASPEWHDIPIIFLTSKTETEDIVRGFELGAVDYVGKPFNAHELLARVNTHLSMDRLRRENERLLLNILPAAIAERLRSGNELIADGFAEVSVLFADIVGFTHMTASMSAENVVEMLNDLFTRFDLAAHEFSIEKIKTIGDAYMAVCGLPDPCVDHTEKIMKMAVRMMQIAHEFSAERNMSLQLRIGVNTGPVVAGIIGRRKFIYDLWGDTVNLASRMESHGIPDTIQVTRSVFEKVKDQYSFEPRGAIEVKGKGAIETWILAHH
ncbi:MAG: adenylate/guanylate cyclase domain-containing response regulator [Acidobacteria bacterium]|nr:MAG: adenylate/guanylate cyclase domain-containing response regulator [Acidobacteriota bacterium]